MSEDLKLVLQLVGQDNASATLRAVTESLASLDRQAKKTGETLKRSLGTELLKPLAKVRVESKAFGDDLTEAAEKAGKALRADIATVAELRTSLRGAVSEQKAFAEAARASQAAGAAAARSQTTAARNAATGCANATANDLRSVRQRWRVREASERAERREVDRSAKAAASLASTKAKAESSAFDRRIRDARYLMGVRERSEAAEMRHLRTASRERESMRRHAMTAGRHAYGHARHAVRSVNHPAFESAGHAAALGAAFGAAAAHTILERSIDIDSAVARYRMFAVPEGVDAGKATAEAVRAAKLDSVKLGMDASTLLDIQAKAVRDGISPTIAKTLPESIAAAAKVMGGDPERLTDTLSEGIQQGLSMGLMKDAGDVRRFLNLEAGLSNYAGNSSVKMEQFVAAGGIGRGKELGLSLTDTMAYGALLNSSGMRTGQATSRFLGQLSQSVPKMGDKYRQAIESHKNSEENRAVRSAPRALGYGSIREMQSQILAGPEGMIEFAVRLNKLNEKQRKLILEGYGFSEQGGGALAEIGASPEKANGVLKRAKELASQAQANDYLSQKFADWQTSLANMLQQIEAGWRAIESEVGDVLKNDIVSPIRDWWVTVSAAILNSGMKDEAHRAITAFINGLGFADMRTALDAMSGNLHGVDVAGFAKGVGEGLRAVYDNLARLAGLFGHGAGGLDAEAFGKFAAELLGLSASLHVAAPAITMLGGIASGVLAIKAAVEGVAIVARLTGIADGLRAVVGVELAATAGGLLSIAGGLTAIGAAVQALLSAGVLSRIEVPHDMSKGAWDGFLWGHKPDGSSARPGWVDGITGGGTKPGESLVRGPHGGVMGAPQGFKPTAYEGGDDANNWRNLLTKASWEPSNAGDIARDAMLDTPRRLVEVREAVDRLGIVMRTASTLSGSGSVTGAGDGGGTPNMRYGRGGSGRYRGTPGTGQDYSSGPKVSLGKMGAKFASKAPVIMDGLMKKYGLTREQAAGVVGNLGHESAGFTAYHEGGQASAKGGVGWAQWTGPRRRQFEAWTKAHGLNPTSDEASWRYLTEGDPETAGAIAAVKGTNNRHDATRAWEQKFERAGVKNYASRDRYADQAFAGTPGGATIEAAAPGTPGGSGKSSDAVDNMSKLEGAGPQEAAQAMGKAMHFNAWCADFVNSNLAKVGIKGSGSAMAASFSGWGQHVDTGGVQKGDVIAENRHGDRVNHVGMATGLMKDVYGNIGTREQMKGAIAAVQMISGNFGNKVKKNWEQVGIISDIRRSNEAVAAAATKVTKQSDEVAKQVPSNARPRPGADDADRARDVTADASQRNADGGRSGSGHTIHMAFHHHVSDHEQHARAVGREVDRVLADRSHDIDHFNV